MNWMLGRGRQIGDDVEGDNIVRFMKETAARTGRSERDVRPDADGGGKIGEREEEEKIYNYRNPH